MASAVPILPVQVFTQYLKGQQKTLNGSGGEGCATLSPTPPAR